MTHTPTNALELAMTYHKEQKYGDYPYMYHLTDVVNKLGEIHGHSNLELLEQLSTVAWLHDILEDTDCEYETIGHVVGWRLADAVLALTKRKGEVYEDYIKKVKADPIALQVKIADTFCNLNASLIDRNDRRIRKYSHQLYLLVG